jgi:iron complex outermembrane receptor protein
MTKTTISLIAAAVLLHANEPYEITITSSPFQTTEKKATFSTEIFTSDDIKKSKVSTIYEFLNEQSSINVMPSSGNIYAQKIDMRGFGITDGYQNIVVIVDGQRLNNIDMTTQLLSSIPVDIIEQIEIIKGSGSVKYGDGATAGVINIITNGKYKNNLSIYSGNNGTKGASFTFGYNTDTMIINALWDDSSTDGNRDIRNGETDNKSQTISKLGIKVFPTNDLEVRATTSQTDIKNKYANGMTKASFDSNPSGLGTISSGIYYSQNKTEVTTNSLGASYYLDTQNKISFDMINEDKKNDYIVPSIWKADYETTQKNIDYGFNNDSLKLNFGANIIDSKRKTSSSWGDSEMSKDNFGYFAHSEFSFEKSSLSFGARQEKVEYKNIKENLDYDEELEAFDIGYNQVLNDNQSFFINANKSYQAPDIDRFYNSDGEFNTNGLKPATSKTLNIGFNDFRDNNKLKITLFNSKLENEIYLIPGTWENSNIDKSSKYGLELFDKYKINDTFYSSLNYSYVIAKIDSEIEDGVTYNDKTMPGVSKHNLTANFGGDYGKTSFALSHKYKSEAYNSEDFANNATQKQKAYNSTNLSMKYNIEKNVEIYAKVNNIFEVKNGMWVKDDHIYPFDFERTYTVGINATF